jgi:hypothetical protein
VLLLDTQVVMWLPLQWMQWRCQLPRRNTVVLCESNYFNQL